MTQEDEDFLDAAVNAFREKLGSETPREVIHPASDSGITSSTVFFPTKPLRPMEKPRQDDPPPVDVCELLGDTIELNVSGVTACSCNSFGRLAFVSFPAVFTLTYNAGFDQWEGSGGSVEFYDANDDAGCAVLTDTVAIEAIVSCNDFGLSITFFATTSAGAVSIFRHLNATPALDTSLANQDSCGVPSSNFLATGGVASISLP